MAEIHPRLIADCIPLVRLPLCHLLLMNDSNFPWFILVPDREGIREIYQLDDADRAQLLRESCQLGEFLMRHFAGDKLNVAALGNQVPQLHLHHIVRHEDDPAWPAPVWGRLPPAAYAADAVDDIRAAIAQAGIAG
jgi:diadenosine tetraphosphate (Ap4A) HIT family hydrolase